MHSEKNLNLSVDGRSHPKTKLAVFVMTFRAASPATVDHPPHRLWPGRSVIGGTAQSKINAIHANTQSH